MQFVKMFLEKVYSKKCTLVGSAYQVFSFPLPQVKCYATHGPKGIPGAYYLLRHL